WYSCPVRIAYLIAPICLISYVPPVIIHIKDVPPENDFVKIVNLLLRMYQYRRKNKTQYTRAKRDNCHCVLCRGGNSETGSLKSVNVQSDMINFQQLKDIPMPDNFFENLEELIERLMIVVAIDKKLSYVADQVSDMERAVEFSSNKTGDFVKKMLEITNRIEAV
ncbi:hypothetical protein J6590_107266, partial [Homalodisca vitripennis]